MTIPDEGVVAVPASESDAADERPATPEARLRELLVRAIDRSPCEAILLRKDPIEIGSGATALGGFLAEGLAPIFPGEAARVLAEDRVVLRDPEHLAYYRIYRSVFGGPPRADPALPKECPGCHARGPEGTYCTVCGAYPI